MEEEGAGGGGGGGIYGVLSHKQGNTHEVCFKVVRRSGAAILRVAGEQILSAIGDICFSCLGRLCQRRPLERDTFWAH